LQRRNLRRIDNLSLSDKITADFYSGPGVVSNITRGQMSISTPEKRRFPRLDSVHLVSYTQLDDEKNTLDMGICKSLDLSLGGVTIQTHRSFPVNALLEMVIAIEERLVRLKGRVVHARKAGKGKHEIGVCFTEVEEQDRAGIQHFFEKISSV